MKSSVALLQSELECQELDAFLADRIYEFNVKSTGYADGRLLAGCIRDSRDEIVAGFNGHTWGGCCEITYLWVHEQHRGKGLGAQLLQAAEAEAVARGCVQLVLATHSFQAPQFYEHFSYEKKYALEGRPQAHSQIFYTKRLREKDDPRQHASRSAELIGTWKLLTFMAEVQATGAKLPIFGPTPKGRLLILEPGQMMTVVTAGGTATPGIVAYSGSYEINGDQFTTHVDVSSNEAWVGTSQSRTFEFVGSRLHLSTDWGPSPFDSTAVVRGISEWERET